MTQFSTEKVEIARGLVCQAENALRELHTVVSAMLHQGNRLFVRLESGDLSLTFPAVAQLVRLDGHAAVEVTVSEIVRRTIEQSGLRALGSGRDRLLVNWNQIVSIEDGTDPPRDDDDPTACAEVAP